MAEQDPDEAFAMAPVFGGLCPVSAIFDGSLDLESFAMMNEALALRGENQYRAGEAARRRSEP